MDDAIDGAGGSAGPYVEETGKRRVVAPSERLCAVTDVGRVRDHNEDAFFVSPDGQILVVADGMGGHAAGEVASALAIESVVEYLDTEKRREIDAAPDATGPVLLQAVKAAHERVLEAAAQGSRQRGMGTTLLIAYVNGDTLHTCHVGDVRCYVHANGSLHQLTRDHSLVEMLVRAGEIKPEEARVHPRKNEVLQAVGLPARLLPSVGSHVLASGDRVLLCSDGLWEALSDNEIGVLLAWQGSMRQCAIQLVNRANEAGGRDNITVVLYEHAGETSDELA
jgi:protein phosphatase